MAIFNSYVKLPEGKPIHWNRDRGIHRQAELRQVHRVVPGQGFVALKRDGSLVAWGGTAVKHDLTELTEVGWKKVRKCG